MKRPDVARWLAIGVSVALHAALAAVLFVFAREPLQRAFQPAGAVEVGVVFSEPKRPPVAGARQAPSSSAGLAEPRRARAARPATSEPRAAPEAPAPAALQPVPAAEGETAAPAAVAVAASESDVAVPVAGQEGGTRAVAATSGTGTGTAQGSADGLGTGEGGGGGGGSAGAGTGSGDVDHELRSRLAASAARCYPRAAQRFRAEGTTRVRFCVADDGRPRDEEVVESSGQSLLDDAALRCVIAKAAPFPRTASCFTVPIHFFVP